MLLNIDSTASCPNKNSSRPPMRWPRPITAGLKVDHSQLGEFVSPLAYEKKEKEQRQKRGWASFCFLFFCLFLWFLTLWGEEGAPIPGRVTWSFCLKPSTGGVTFHVHQKYLPALDLLNPSSILHQLRERDRQTHSSSHCIEYNSIILLSRKNQPRSLHISPEPRGCVQKLLSVLQS